MCGEAYGRDGRDTGSVEATVYVVHFCLKNWEEWEEVLSCGLRNELMVENRAFGLLDPDWMR